MPSQPLIDSLLFLEEMAHASQRMTVNDQPCRDALTEVWRASDRRRPDLYKEFWKWAGYNPAGDGAPGITRSQNLSRMLNGIYRDVGVERSSQMMFNEGVWARARERR